MSVLAVEKALLAEVARNLAEENATVARYMEVTNTELQVAARQLEILRLERDEARNDGERVKRQLQLMQVYTVTAFGSRKR